MLKLKNACSVVYESENFSKTLAHAFQAEGSTSFPRTMDDDGPEYHLKFEFETPGENGATFRTSNDTGFLFMTTLSFLFPMTINVSPKSSDFRYHFSGLKSYGLIRPVAKNAWASGIERFVNGMADLMSNVMIASYASTDNVTGTAWRQETYISVRWAWLSLPFGLLVLSLAFLLVTIFKAENMKTRERIGIWKTSALAVLMNGLTDDARKAIHKSHGVGEARACTKEVCIKLAHGKDGYRLCRGDHNLLDHSGKSTD